MAKYNAKLTEEVCRKLCEALSKGHSIEAACSYANIGRTTYYNWYNKGTEAKSGKFKQFVCDVDNALGEAVYNVEKVVLDNIPTNPNDAKWWLSKRNKNYADKSYTETKLDATVETDVTLNLLDRVKEKRQELNDLTND